VEQKKKEREKRKRKSKVSKLRISKKTGPMEFKNL